MPENYQSICDDIMSYISINRNQETFTRKELVASITSECKPSTANSALNRLTRLRHINIINTRTFALTNRDGLTPYKFADGIMFNPSKEKSIKAKIAEGEKKLQERQQLENTQRQQQLNGTIQQMKTPSPEILEQQAQLADQLAGELAEEHIELAPKAMPFTISTAATHIRNIQRELQNGLNTINTVLSDCDQLLESTKLLPCKCGKQPEIIGYGRHPLNQESDSVAIVCKCGMQTKPQYWFITEYASLYSALQEAIQIWGIASDMENAA